ncbi:type IV pilus modification PilV family protein [Brassicibacter mesophilus]|uniref:type IV pilus modification PilV family protein n=1 Tax=Brassicibacter mesophilus TaxID=745119 RepID=UPI003D2504A8
MVKRLNNNIGLSLIELLFTLAILGITVIAVSSLLVNTAKINKKSEQQYNATLLAQSYMECIKASSDINIGRTIHFDDDFKIIIDISEIDEYHDKMYKVIIEIISNGNILEKLGSYKVLYY